jgi:HSP20 family protein
MAKGRENTQPTKDDQSLARRENAFPNTGPLLSPFGLMRRLIEEFDRIGSATESVWSPALEVFERDGKLVVRADVPGIEKDQVKIEVSDDQLMISGERSRKSEERREGFYRSERSYGSFCRIVDLPPGVDTEQATATFDNGVLEITMPAPQRSESKRIEIREGSAAATSTPTSAPQQQSAARDANPPPAH